MFGKRKAHSKHLIPFMIHKPHLGLFIYTVQDFNYSQSKSNKPYTAFDEPQLYYLLFFCGQLKSKIQDTNNTDNLKSSFPPNTSITTSSSIAL